MFEKSRFHINLEKSKKNLNFLSKILKNLDFIHDI